VALREAVVVEDGLDALLPLAALIDERMAQADPGAQIEQVVGRNPGLGQAPDHPQLAQMPGVGAVSLGALLVAAPRRGLRWLGEMDVGTDRAQLLDDEPPARRRLQGDLEALAGEAPEEPAHVRAQRRRESSAGHFAGVGIDPLGRDLCAVLIEVPLRSPSQGLLKLHG